MELGAAESAVRVEIKDDGPPFDPLSAAPITEPDPMTGGGIGLAIVHAWAESPTYMWQSDQNTLALMLR
ncbi:MAG: ATP-binding protein, partial [Pseudomonadota bacterium]